MKKMNKLLALLFALVMLFTLTAYGGSVDGDIQPEELGAGTVKWSEKKTGDGWIRVLNEGGKTLGYSPNSGVSLIQVDGFAFKDLNRDGMLQPYEDWRLDPETRAHNLADALSVDEMIPLFTHGGWMSFGPEITGQDLIYVESGGRAGVTRSAGNAGNTGGAVEWVNALQSLCEATGNWGIPATVSVDPCNISATIDKLTLGATFDTDIALELGKIHGKMYRAVGITMLLGPQIDITTTPILDRAEGTYTEDPALSRDLADAYISGLQSTWDEDGNDLGWGEDSVYAIVKHYAGAGAAEGGRNDHSDPGKYDVFPGEDFGAHLVAFFDGAFNLKGSVTHEAGVMPNYGISYSSDGSLGELVGGAYSSYKIGLLYENDYQGLIVTDFGVDMDGSEPFGVEDLTQAERFALLLKNGIHQVGGSSAIGVATEGYELVVEELGEEKAMELLRNVAYHSLLSQFQCGLFDNAYIDYDYAIETVYTAETEAAALAMQEKTVIMLKNNDNTIHEAEPDAEKLTVYIPYKFSTGTSPLSFMGVSGSASWKPALDLSIAEKYFNVVTDTPIEADEAPAEEAEAPADSAEAPAEAAEAPADSAETPADSEEAPADSAEAPAEAEETAGGDSEGESGEGESGGDSGGDSGDSSADDGPTISDVVRASAEELAACDLVIVTMQAPYTGSAYDEATNTWTPASLQYEPYTAVNARSESIAADEKGDRAYANQSVGQDKNYGDLEMLQYVASVVPETCKIVVLMAANQPMVWSEVEPLADVILLYYPGGVNFNGEWFYKEALLNVVTGKAEPYGLLNLQQPASMDAVEAQKEDLPRDMECYVDENGNTYDFAFGMNWSGVIDDERVQTYKVDPMTEPESIAFHYAN